MEARVHEDNNFGTVYGGLLRAALGYQLTDRITVWQGYGFDPTVQTNYGLSYVAQQESFQAFRYVLPLNNLMNVTFRTMIEESFLPSNGNQIRYRPRQMVRYVKSFEFEPRLSFIFWDEVFVTINTTPAGGKAGFNQNRGFIGAGWVLNEFVRFEGGYMNQYLESTQKLRSQEFK